MSDNVTKRLRQPSPKKRISRATDAANHRWRHKLRLIPGLILPWSQRSRANATRHQAAVEAGGAATKARWAAHKRDFWNWYHGGIKDGASGPIRIVIDTLERVEAACRQRHGAGCGSDPLRWEAFMHYVFLTYVAGPAWTMDVDKIEPEIWAKYHELMDADAARLSQLLEPLRIYEENCEEQALWAHRRRSR